MSQIPLFKVNNLKIEKKNMRLLSIKKFEIHKGAWYVFSGKFGCGKSTILEALNRNNNNYDGEILFENDNIHKVSKKTFNDNIAILNQKHYPPFFNKTVKEYIRNYLKNYNHINNIDQRIDSISKKMNLTNLHQRSIKELSIGQFRWISLASRIAADTRILFIDDLEQGLGKSEINTLANILYKKCNFDGVTIISSSQNRDYFLKSASVIILMEYGKINSVRSYNSKKNN